MIMNKSVGKFTLRYFYREIYEVFSSINESKGYTLNLENITLVFTLKDVNFKIGKGVLALPASSIKMFVNINSVDRLYYYLLY